MSSKSVFVDFVLLAIMLFCIVSLAVLGVRGATQAARIHASPSVDETFSPRIVTVDQSR